MFLLIVVLFCLFRLMSGSSEVRRAGARLQVFDQGSLPRLPMSHINRQLFSEFEFWLI
jgi:hypothetical protein